MNEETTYKLFKLIEANPELSQRDLAKNMNVSLGKVNYCLRALKEKGLVKVQNFKNNPNKRGYIYVLTPKGVNERMRVTARFLKNKLNEYEKLKKEIEQLQQETD